MVVGSALLLPVVPSGVAGLLLTGFSGGLLGLYIKTPGMRQEGSLRPTHQGIPLAKDSWLLGIGVSLILSDVIDRASEYPGARAPDPTARSGGRPGAAGAGESPAAASGRARGPARLQFGLISRWRG